jgi:hypothetical protein
MGLFSAVSQGKSSGPGKVFRLPFYIRSKKGGDKNKKLRQKK